MHRENSGTQKKGTKCLTLEAVTTKLMNTVTEDTIVCVHVTVTNRNPVYFHSCTC